MEVDVEVLWAAPDIVNMSAKVFSVHDDSNGMIDL
jgi:hypothetical protein